MSFEKITKVKKVRHAGEGRHPVVLAAKHFLDTGLRRYDIIGNVNDVSGEGKL